MKGLVHSLCFTVRSDLGTVGLVRWATSYYCHRKLEGNKSLLKKYNKKIKIKIICCIIKYI